MCRLVILAAGSSHRLGSPKALAKLRSSAPQTAIEILLESADSIFPTPPLIVAGAHFTEIERQLQDGIAQQALELLYNPNWEAGRTGGLALAAAHAPGFDLCVAPVDVPAVPRDVFSRLSAEWKHAARPASGWLAPSTFPPGKENGTRKRFGHPIIVGRDLARKVCDMDPDRPLRELRAQAQVLLDCPVSTDAILDDLDTQSDLERIRKRFPHPF